MQRRELIAGVLALIARASTADAADPPLVAVLLVNIRAPSSGVWRRLVNDLQAIGYTEGLTVRYAVRASTDPAGLANFAAELIKLGPQVIYANGDEAARAAAAASTSIPIVAMTDDHIASGLTDNLAHPSRNVTGVSRLEADLDTKRLELLHELAPVSGILALRDPQTTWRSRTTQLEQAAARLGVQLQIRDVRDAGDVAGAIAEAHANGFKAVLVLGSPFLSTFNVDDEIIDAARALNLPTMVQIPSTVNRGHLAGYGVNQDAAVTRLAYMIDRILKGAAPSTIPVEQPTKFDFAVNLKRAKMLGLTIPQSLLARADEVIE
jgi:putative tryptophan/tyrosine transport system substrate-binding protein